MEKQLQHDINVLFLAVMIWLAYYSLFPISWHVLGQSRQFIGALELLGAFLLAGGLSYAYRIYRGLRPTESYIITQQAGQQANKQTY